MALDYHVQVTTLKGRVEIQIFELFTLRNAQVLLFALRAHPLKVVRVDNLLAWSAPEQLLQKSIVVEFSILMILRKVKLVTKMTVTQRPVCQGLVHLVSVLEPLFLINYHVLAPPEVVTAVYVLDKVKIQRNRRMCALDLRSPPKFHVGSKVSPRLYQRHRAIVI